ncbi:hypothetical protein PoB_004832400 [Plakobranchus ocellatus]|uniref:Uncharacterized protein n=1 Tax=Plakobranchus ocellatus TaxID=259542 RepID=A0AAV4BSM7_9GAST|nr:hypothetical protein PoB_004832400 [Plakobranchus ocellatus]
MNDEGKETLVSADSSKRDLGSGIPQRYSVQLQRWLTMNDARKETLVSADSSKRDLGSGIPQKYNQDNETNILCITNSYIHRG